MVRDNVIGEKKESAKNWIVRRGRNALINRIVSSPWKARQDKKNLDDKRNAGHLRG